MAFEKPDKILRKRSPRVSSRNSSYSSGGGSKASLGLRAFAAIGVLAVAALAVRGAWDLIKETEAAEQLLEDCNFGAISSQLRDECRIDPVPSGLPFIHADTGQEMTDVLNYEFSPGESKVYASRGTTNASAMTVHVNAIPTERYDLTEQAAVGASAEQVRASQAVRGMFDLYDATGDEVFLIGCLEEVRDMVNAVRENGDIFADAPAVRGANSPESAVKFDSDLIPSRLETLHRHDYAPYPRLVLDDSGSTTGLAWDQPPFPGDNFQEIILHDGDENELLILCGEASEYGG